MTRQNTVKDFRIFFNYHLLNGVETKRSRLLDLAMNVVKQAPEYGVHFVIITDMLPGTGGDLNSAFNKIIFYQPTRNLIGQLKLADDYPDNSLDCMYIYADKTKTSDICVKIKKPEMLEEG